MRVSSWVSVAAIWRSRAVFSCGVLAAEWRWRKVSICSASWAILSWWVFSIGLEKSMLRIGSSPKYCFVQVIQPPRNRLLRVPSRQNRSFELSSPRTVLRFQATLFGQCDRESSTGHWAEPGATGLWNESEQTAVCKKWHSNLRLVVQPQVAGCAVTVPFTILLPLLQGSLVRPKVREGAWQFRLELVLLVQPVVSFLINVRKDDFPFTGWHESVAAKVAGVEGVAENAGLDAQFTPLEYELLEVGEDAEGELGRPGVAAELEGGADVVLDVDGRAFSASRKNLRVPPMRKQ